MNDFDYVTDSNPAKCTAGIKTAEKKSYKIPIHNHEYMVLYNLLFFIETF